MRIFTAGYTTNIFNVHVYMTWMELEEMALRKHGYSNILKISPQKTENFQMKKKSDIFHISAESIDCGYSLEPPL